MPDTTGLQSTFAAKGRHFNFYKLQAVLCMAASALVSIGFVAWVIAG